MMLEKMTLLDFWAFCDVGENDPFGFLGFLIQWLKK
jgi:hypothetical protein